MATDETDDDEADAAYLAAIGVLLGERGKVAAAYRRLGKFIIANCGADSPLCGAHFCEAMAYLMGEVVADNLDRAEWDRAFDALRTLMANAAERHHAN
jgi:hypothetical protein